MRSARTLRFSSLIAILVLAAAVPGCDGTPVNPSPSREEPGKPNLQVVYWTDPGGMDVMHGTTVTLEDGEVVFRSFSRTDRIMKLQVTTMTEITGTNDFVFLPTNEVVVEAGTEAALESRVPADPGPNGATYWQEAYHFFWYTLHDGTKWGTYTQSLDELYVPAP